MILAVAATEFEMASFMNGGKNAHVDKLVSGVGPLESCLRLTQYLENHRSNIDLLVNFGVAGAYICGGENTLSVLDICLARSEVFGDFGICFPLRVDDLLPEIGELKFFQADPGLLSKTEKILTASGLPYRAGGFVTVSCVSGTRGRGQVLAEKYGAICENMEGAALARVCTEYSLPFMELRCVSNLVEDRDTSAWSLEQACEKAGKTTETVVTELGKIYEKH